jgi:serine protease Do
MKRSNMDQGIAIFAFVAGGVLCLAAPDRMHASIDKATTAPSERLTAPLASPRMLDFQQISAQYAPAVVGIAAAPRANAVGQIASALGRRDVTRTYSPDDPFFRFFRYLPISHRAVRADSLGSGFIISTDGLILTNAHLVGSAGRVAVMLADRRKFEAKILGVDLLTDVAVLKIDARNLPTVRLGNLKSLTIGDSVLVIGHPYGLEENAVSGIVKATGHSASLVPFIQTDVAAGLGDSGGPLVDSRGQVVGMSAQISTGAAGYDRVSYAIPIDVALRLKSEVARTDGHEQLGIELEPLAQSLVSGFQCPHITDALITRVMLEGIAASAGLRPADLHSPVSDDATTEELLRDGRVFTTRLTCCEQVPHADSTDGRIDDLPRYPRARVGFPTRPTPPPG